MSSAPVWFNADVYFANKLAAMNDGANAIELIQAFHNAGYATDAEGLYRHFIDYGDKEWVSPAAYFNNQQYMVNKAALYYGTSTPTVDQVGAMTQAVRNAGLSAWDHYTLFGWREGVNPSFAFDSHRYVQDKLTAMGGSITAEQLYAIFIQNGLNPLTHYLGYGIHEGLHITPPGGVWPLVHSETADKLLEQDIPGTESSLDHDSLESFGFTDAFRAVQAGAPDHSTEDSSIDAVRVELVGSFAPDADFVPA